MYFVHPSDTERYALRLLLLYRKGCYSFHDLRTVNGITYHSFRETCRALGYLENDNESDTCLNEATNFATASQLRELFAVILLNCTPSNPGLLWEKYRQAMSDDILYEVRKLDSDAQFNDEIYNKALHLINDILMKTSHHVNNFSNLPKLREITNPTLISNSNKILQEELNYDAQELKQYVNEKFTKTQSRSISSIYYNYEKSYANKYIWSKYILY
jgi:hypothetical protein